MERSTLATAIGASLIPLGLLIGVGLEQYKLIRNQQPDFITPIVRAAIFAALLGSYVGLQNGILKVVNYFGSMESSSTKVISLFEKRWDAFNTKAGIQKAQEEGAQGEEGSTIEKIGQVLSNLTPTSIFNVIFNLIAYISFVLVMAVIYILQKTQLLLIAIAFKWGPICIGFAALHPFFNTMAISWFWTYVEVAAWGISMNILLGIIGNIDSTIADKMLSTYDTSDAVLTYADNFFVNVVYIFMVMSVPAVTSMMIRSQSASAVGGRAFQSVGSGMLSAGAKVGGAYLAVGGAMGSSATGAAKNLLGRLSGGGSSSGSTEKTGGSSSSADTTSRKGD